MKRNGIAITAYGHDFNEIATFDGSYYIWVERDPRDQNAWLFLFALNTGNCRDSGKVLKDVFSFASVSTGPNGSTRSYYCGYKPICLAELREIYPGITIVDNKATETTTYKFDPGTRTAFSLEKSWREEILFYVKTTGCSGDMSEFIKAGIDVTAPADIPPREVLSSIDIVRKNPWLIKTAIFEYLLIGMNNFVD